MYLLSDLVKLNSLLSNLKISTEWLVMLLNFLQDDIYSNLKGDF